MDLKLQPSIDREVCAIVCNGNHIPRDIEIFFDPEDNVVFLPNGTMLSDILVWAGIFPSRNQARKNGFHELPEGWMDRKIGKLKTRFCILNPLPEQ